MGNVKNPLIKRWGLNLFWYKFWFNDKNYSFNLNFFLIIEKILYFILFYGIFFPKNIYFNKYWLKKKKI